MAAVRHLDFAKISVLVLWPISACDSSFPSKFRINWQIWCRRHITKNDFQYGVRPPFWICKILIFLNIHPRNGNSHPCTKFDRNQIIHGWDMEIKLFSKWQPSAILNLRNLPFWSCGLYVHVILNLWSKFRIDRPIWRPDIAKKRFSI